jgi:hypothetical protein
MVCPHLVQYGIAIISDNFAAIYRFKGVYFGTSVDLLSIHHAPQKQFYIRTTGLTE